jgi:hypothetical protein
VWAWLFVPCIILQYFMLVLPSKIRKKINFVPIMCSTPILNPPLLKREKQIFFLNLLLNTKQKWRFALFMLVILN